MPTPGPGGFENVDLGQLGLSPSGAVLDPSDLPAPQPLIASDPVPEPEPEPVEPEELPEDPEGEEEPEEATSEAEDFELPDGSRMSLERVRELAALDYSFRQDPDLQRRVFEAVRPTAIPPGQQLAPAPVAPTAQVPVPAAPPPELDMDDPVSRYLWTQGQATEARIAALQQTIEQQNNQQAQLLRRQGEVGMTAARNNVATRYGLNPDEIAKVEQTAARVANLQGLMDEEGGSIERAAVRAMEMAIAFDPQLRGRITQQKDSPTDKRRKANLSALAGTSGTAPRVEPAKPMTRQERVNAAAADIERAQAGQQV